MKKVAIIILNYGGDQDTLKCLNSLRQMKAVALSLQPYLVDYGKKAILTSQVKNFFSNTVIIRKEENLGFAAGNNVGIVQALADGADYVLLLNNDTLVSANFLSHLYSYLEEHPEVAAVSPKIYFAKGYEYHLDRYAPNERGRVIWYVNGKIDWQNMYGYHPNVDEVDNGQWETVHNTEFISGCCVLIPRKHFQEIGLLNEKLFMYWEDVEWSLRAKKAGYALVVCSQSIIEHKNAGGSSSGSALQDYFTTRNRLWMGMHYAPLRTKLALIRQSLVQLKSGRKWEKRGVLDFYLSAMYKGSWK